MLFQKKMYELIAIDLSKQQGLDVNLKAMQQINFNASLDRVEDSYVVFILKENVKESINFTQGTV